MEYIIEHLEPEMFEWCLIEYGHISEIVGKENLIFTNVKKEKDRVKLKKVGAVCDKKISELGDELNLDNKKACVLSQYASKTLNANDRNKFEYFVFGGILGDN